MGPADFETTTEEILFAVSISEGAHVLFFTGGKPVKGNIWFHSAPLTLLWLKNLQRATLLMKRLF